MPKKPSPTPPKAVLQPENAVCENGLGAAPCLSEAEWLVEFGHIDYPNPHFAYSCSECLPDLVAMGLQIQGNEIEPSPFEPYAVKVAAYTPGQPILPKPILAEPEEVTLDTTDSLTVRIPNSDVDN